MSEISAYHEAGHAVIAICVGAEVRSVTVDPDWDDGPKRYGDAQVAWPIKDYAQQELAEKKILVALAGPIAEMIYSGDPFHPALVPEWSNDWAEAWEAAADLHQNHTLRLDYLEKTTVRLHQLMSGDDYWAGLAAVVDHLLAHETLEGEQVREILEQWLC